MIAKAVSDKDGTTTLRVPVAGGIAMDALATIEAANRFASNWASEFATHTVPTVTLDQILLPLVQGGEQVAFVNIDVEGHEFAVLKGGDALIARERPVLLVELEYRHGARVGEVFDWLKAQRYVPRALADGKSLTPIDPTASPARLARPHSARPPACRGPPLGLRQQHLLSPRSLDDVPSLRAALAKLVYIGGYGRSGSTLLEYLLTTSPEVVACGEVGAASSPIWKQQNLYLWPSFEEVPSVGSLSAQIKKASGMKS